MRARDPSQYGSLTLVFLRSASAPGGLQLYGWTAIDAQSRRTTVKLSNVRYNVAVPESAFTLRRAEEAVEIKKVSFRDPFIALSGTAS